MIEGLKPHEEYMRTSMVWAGDLPSHWSTPRMKHILRERSQKGFPDEPLLAATQTKGVVRKEEYENRTVVALKDLHLLKLVCERDFVISLRSFQGGIEYARHRGIISPAYTILYPERSPNQGYLAWLFKSKPYIENLTLHVTGIRQGQNIDYDRLRRSQIPLPPPDEQAAIVRFLDHADRRIRRYIRAKRQLIALLNEQKQAIIHRAVTRGLDPNARLKPAGVEWLGEVPEDWNVLRLARVIADGPRNGISPPVNENGAIESFSISAIRDGRVEIREGDKKFVSGDKAALEAAYCLRAGDVLLVRGNGNIRLVGKAGLVEHDMPGRIYPDLLMRVRVSSKCLPQYLVLLLNCPIGRDQIEMVAKTAVGTFKVNNQQVRQMCFALPPIEEQQAIIEWLGDELKTVNAMSSRAEEEIALLREFRTRLIADVVTGKLDVRDAASRLPEEVGGGRGDTEDLLQDNDVAEEAELDAEAEEVEA